MGLALSYAGRGWRAGAVDDGPMDGQAAAALSARAPAAAGAHDRRHDRLFMRASSDVAVRVRRGHLRAGADRAVQSARRAGAGSLTPPVTDRKYPSNGLNHQSRKRIAP